jgi:hypothetical protein
VVTRAAPTSRPVVVRGVADDQIGAAIQRGVDFLLRANVKNDAPTADKFADVPGRFGKDPGGEEILTVYALLQCGRAIDDPRLDVKRPFMNGLVEGIKKPQNFDFETYSRGVRATALAVYNRKQDRDRLGNDVALLLRGHENGAYYYSLANNPGPRGARPRRSASLVDYDNSNSQYGLLGVWAGAESGIEVPNGYWNQVRNHWVNEQLDNGQWSYKGGNNKSYGGGSTSMTAAGTASLFVAEEYLDLSGQQQRKGNGIERAPLSPSLERAMRWWAEGDHAVDYSGAYPGYTLYGIERVGLASGYKHLGTHDWYRELAQQVIARQNANGAWSDDDKNVETSFNLLFLARGRHPILMNKLAYTGFWNNRSRDTANLTRYATNRLEREFNWQVVSLAADWTDWLDSPVLYIAGYRRIPFTEEQIGKLRAYVHAGGMIFTHADGGSAEFNAFVKDLATRLFPRYELTDVPAKHPIYSVFFPIKRPPALKMLTNGARILLVHSPQDIAKAWQQRDSARFPDLFETGVNVFVYAAGKRNFRNRLDIGFMPETPGTPTSVVRVARLSYAGNWDPEPAAWRHFGAVLKQQTGMGVEVVETPLKSLKAGLAPVAHLTGTVAHAFTGDEAAAVRAYVEAGGVLVVDTCGGTGDFSDAARQALSGIFSSTAFELMPRAHPLLNVGPPGMQDLSAPQLRQSTADRRNAGNTYDVLRAGNGVVLLAPFDVTCGLLGANAYDVRGYTPAYAQSLMTNTLFWTLDGKPDEPSR